MAARVEIDGNTYEISIGIDEQKAVEDAAKDKPFSSVMQRFFKGFTGDMMLIMQHCVKRVDEKGTRMLEVNEYGNLVNIEANTILLIQAFMEAADEWAVFIGTKAVLPTPSSNGVEQVTAPNPSTKSGRGKSN